MTKALCVVFFQYTPRADAHYRTQGDLFFKYLKRCYEHFDHLYIVDAGWNIDENDLHPNTTVIRDDFRSHWWYLNKLTSLVEEDEILYVDPDFLIYNPEFVKQGFDYLELFDIAGILDNSGTTEFFPANENRAVRRRFTPYCTFMRRDLLQGIDVDFTPTQKDGKFQYDSMGLLTEQILAKNPTFQEIPDDRTTLRLMEDGSITKDSNLDGPTYAWSLPLDAPKNLGFYHVRNSSVGLSLLVEYEHDRDAYNRRKSLMPFSEAMRLLAWQYMYDKHTGNLQEWESKYPPVLEDYGVNSIVWNNYIEQFEEYHSWIKE